MWHVDFEHPISAINDKDDLPISRFVNGEGLLNNKNILHDGWYVKNTNNFLKEDLKDMETSSIVLVRAIASEQCHVVRIMLLLPI